MEFTLSALAQALRANITELTERWRTRCQADPQLAIVISQLSFREFQDNVPAAILHFSASLERCGQANKEADQTEVAEHGHHRWKQGYSLRELMREWGCLTAVLLEFTDDFFRGADTTAAAVRSQAFMCLTDFNTEAGSASVARYDQLKRAEAATLLQDLEVVRSSFEQAGRARSDLLREAAHDLRGGLSTIAGATDLLKFRARASADTSNMAIDMLDRSVQWVRTLLDSLLDLTRLESGEDPAQLSYVDMGPLLMGLVEQHRPAAELKQLQFVAAGPQSLRVCTDPNKVRRIVQNLLTNAIHHTVHGKVELQWAVGNDYWLMLVSDTGPGMDRASAPPVAREMGNLRAEPSEHTSLPSAEYSGEGIGLLIVKKLCRTLEATINMTTKTNVGTSFEVRFPLHVSPDTELAP